MYNKTITSISDKLTPMSAWFYILRLQTGRFYCGATKDLERRAAEHFKGRGCRTTKGDPPVELVYSEEFDTYSEALKREAQVKKWTRKRKVALIAK